MKDVLMERCVAATLMPEGGYIVVYESSSDGSIDMQRLWENKTIPTTEAAAWVDNHRGYKRMFDFIGEAEGTEARRDISITIGPGGSWFARRGRDVLYHNLPLALKKLFRQRDKEGIVPLHVALGAQNSYIVLWSDRETCNWRLNGYGELSKHLDEGEIPDTVALSPYDQDRWFLVRSNGAVLWSLHFNGNEVKDIAREARAYMQRRARQDGSTFEMHSTLNDGQGPKVPYTITPDTHFDTDDSKSESLVRAAKRREWLPARILAALGANLESSSSASYHQKLADRHNLIALSAAGAAGALIATTAALPPARRLAVSAIGLGTGSAALSWMRTRAAPGVAVFATGTLCFIAGRYLSSNACKE
ncbi:hypothetical protein BAUCODRAFT_29004 [Baudoinia panamericana UAMH 10762]|uniref:Uncharacterized protein n=1 Tax=Baudoinia panamericana (strain UAMH 10762) TaxID=717646 RepID=M2NMB5_BAUPA|nr:uncharacterized protein BAUCODRAFT_29004 [Baudoinia panamericana UAMH 10762]EMD00655.1 hypothetical protein BAUCODRAFT_29004 [Baudoinia panamericana UAMH 10762]